MQQNHLIDKVTLEIGLNEPVQAFEYQNRCSQLMHGELKELIEQACDDYSRPGEHIIIDRVEVNLGKLSAQNFKWEIVEKFKSRFELKSHKGIQGVTTEPDSEGSMEGPAPVRRSGDLSTFGMSIQPRDWTDSEAETEGQSHQWNVIKYFLNYGCLPWYVKAENFKGFEENLMQLLPASSAIQTEIKRLLQQPENLDRFLSQLSDANLGQLYSLLFKKNSDWTELFNTAEKSLQQLTQSINPVPRQTLWENIWLQSLNQASFDMVLALVWRIILRAYPVHPGLMINHLIQQKQAFCNIEGLDVDAILASLERLKAELQGIDDVFREPSVKLQQEMEGIESDKRLENRDVEDTSHVQSSNPSLSTEYGMDREEKDGPPHDTRRQRNLVDIEQGEDAQKKENTTDETFHSNFSGIESMPGVTKTPEGVDTEQTLLNRQASAVEGADKNKWDIEKFPAEFAAESGLSGLLKETGSRPNAIEKQQISRAPINDSIAVSGKSEKPNSPPESDEAPLQQRFSEFYRRIDTPDKLQREIAASIQKNNQPQTPLEEQPDLERYPVNNAGLVIFWPYLQIYFDDLGLLENKKFRDRQTQQKALHLLQYLATGEQNAEEHALTLNKILCNWDVQQTVERFIDLTDKDKKESEILLNAIINNWSVLGETSIGNLRLNFIQRKGLLQQEDSGWLLRVEKGPYDVLLERLPWGLSMIKLSWMEQLLQVEW